MRHVLTVALLATTMFSLPSVAHAQAMTAEEAAQLRADLAALKAQVRTLETRLDAATAQPASAPVPAPEPPSVTAKPATEISWKGAPEIKTADGWSFKPRGRMQLDVAGVNAPGSVGGNSLGVGTEFRRLFLGVEGKIPGGFGYRVEADFANSSVELTDVYLTYGTGPLTVMAGHTKPFWSLEELTSDLFTSFNERAAFTQAFGFERRVGLSAQYKAKSAMLQAGVFGDHANDLLSDANNSISFDARAVLMPKIGDTQIHLAGSGHFRSFNDQATNTRYRARPFVHTTDVRIVDTGNIGATGERGYGLEAAALRGPFHVASEAFWQTARRPGLADPTFFGGYVEAGLVLTPGDSRIYKDGAFDRLKPSKGIDQGGIGAIEVNVRYDYLDLIDKGIVGGKQRTAGISLVWAPIQYVRIIANYGRLRFDQAAVTAAGDRDYSADAFGLRTQFDF
ncbi:MAG: porin [Sphingopyxis sp.]|nr:porin [Sphingopyxis sp.]